MSYLYVLVLFSSNGMKIKTVRSTHIDLDLTKNNDTKDLLSIQIERMLLRVRYILTILPPLQNWTKWAII